MLKQTQKNHGANAVFDSLVMVVEAAVAQLYAGGRLDLEHADEHLVTMLDFKDQCPAIFPAFSSESSRWVLGLRHLRRAARALSEVPEAAPTAAVDIATPISAVAPPSEVTVPDETTFLTPAEEAVMDVLEVVQDGYALPDHALNALRMLVIDQASPINLDRPAAPKPQVSQTSNQGAMVTSDMPLEALGLSERSYNALRRSNITLIRQALGMSISDLRCVRTITAKAVDEINAKLGTVRRVAA